MTKETRRKIAKQFYEKGKPHPYISEFQAELEGTPTVHAGSFKKGHKRNSHEPKDPQAPVI